MGSATTACTEAAALEQPAASAGGAAAAAGVAADASLPAVEAGVPGAAASARLAGAGPPHARRRVVFVSGCYDILHGGHVEFFRQAKALGDHLVVSVAGDAVLAAHKPGRRPSMPTAHKVALIGALSMVDEVVVGDDLGTRGLDFVAHFRRAAPALLVATEDDKYGDAKRALCAQVGAQYVVLPKGLDFDPVSTTQIIANVRAPDTCPLRVDFAGGWLDVPRHARPGAFIVNCAVSPCVSLDRWPYHIGGGLGGSAAHALLAGRDSVASELALGVGWQDPAVICETGLCVWRSGPAPLLDFKTRGDFLAGRLALLWTGAGHVTPEQADRPRDYDLIARAGVAARAAVAPGAECVAALADAVGLSYDAQLAEGMAPLEAHGALARKYCGGGWGGYALYLFGDEAARAAFTTRVEGAVAVEPYIRPPGTVAPL